MQKNRNTNAKNHHETFAETEGAGGASGFLTKAPDHPPGIGFSADLVQALASSAR